MVETKSYAKAIEDFDRAIQLEPRNSQTYFQRAQARERDNQRDKAIADYRLALARDQNNAEARKALARPDG
ncbi:MAG: tetratricopeptide repeat protein [Pseudolabrys sp.]